MRMFLLAALSASLLFAQDIAGVWQGTLPNGKQALRMLFRISPTSGGFRAVFYSIDQSPQGLAATAAVQGSRVKIAVPGIGATYEGTLGADGASITGTWKSLSGSQPLNLKRATSATAWAIPAAPRVKAMPAGTSPEFEVASIKPAKPGIQGKGIGIRGRQFSTANTSVNDLLTWAYGVNVRQIVGGPDWLESDKYNLAAKPEGDGMPNEKQWKAMLQKLLAERFHLTFHREKRELPVYAIVLAKSGAKLTRSEGNPAGMPGTFLKQPGFVTGNNAAVADLAFLLQTIVLERPVVDQTGLAGKWDFTLKWTPDDDDLFAAMQEQLGLKLISTKSPIDVLAIDRVQRPSGN